MTLKRYSMPKSWRVERKTHTWVAAPRGAHPQAVSMPLQVIVRDVLKLAETAKEAMQVIKQGKVMVDKKVRKDPRFGVGLMDVLEMPEMKKSFRMLIGKQGLMLAEVKGDQSALKLCRVEGKRTVRGGLTQLNLHDGRSVLLKNAKPYSPNDSVVISVPEQSIVKHFKLEKGVPAFIIAGRNVGASGKIKEIRLRKNMTEKSTVILQSKDREILTPLDYVMIGEVA